MEVVNRIILLGSRWRRVADDAAVLLGNSKEKLEFSKGKRLERRCFNRKVMKRKRFQKESGQEVAESKDFDRKVIRQ